MGKLEETDKFMDTYNLTRLSHEETENLSEPIRSNKIEAVIKSLSLKKSPGPDGFTVKFYQTFKELIPIQLELFQKKTKEEEILSNLFCKVSTTLIPKPDKHTTENRLQANITEKHRHKSPQHNISKHNLATH